MGLERTSQASLTALKMLLSSRHPSSPNLIYSPSVLGSVYKLIYAVSNLWYNYIIASTKCHSANHVP